MVLYAKGKAIIIICFLNRIQNNIRFIGITMVQSNYSGSNILKINIIVINKGDIIQKQKFTKYEHLSYFKFKKKEMIFYIASQFSKLLAKCILKSNLRIEWKCFLVNNNFNKICNVK